MSEANVEIVLDALLASGWISSDGVHISDVVKAGNRARFTRPGTEMRCTVGKRSVSFYLVRDGQASGFRNYATATDLEFIRAALLVGTTSEMPETPRDVASRLEHQSKEESKAAIRKENERRFRAQLESGQRVLASSGQRGLVYWRAQGLVIVLHADRDNEIPVCCHKQATYMSYPTIRGRCPVGPKDHDEDCTGMQKPPGVITGE